jgi:hypothetical protein
MLKRVHAHTNNRSFVIQFNASIAASPGISNLDHNNMNKFSPATPKAPKLDAPALDPGQAFLQTLSSSSNKQVIQYPLFIAIYGDMISIDFNVCYEYSRYCSGG